MLPDLLLPAPTPDQVRAARHAAGHTQAQAAALMGYRSGLRVSKIELGTETCDTRSWTLYLLATGQHPAYAAVPRKR